LAASAGLTGISPSRTARFSAARSVAYTRATVPSLTGDPPGV
jgi:hypothetical protein